MDAGAVLDAAARAFQTRSYDAVGDPVSLAAFLDPTFVRRPHLDVIGATYREIGAGQVNRVMISLPPQAGKSTSAVIWGCLWWLIRNPAHRIVVASYADSLAVKHGKAIRALVSEHGPRYGLYLDQTSHAANDWSLTSGGGVRSVGIRSGLTGRGANCLVVDDAHKDRAEADSRTYREAVHDWWSSTAYSRLSPGAPIILIGTRWHPDDLLGRVLGHEGRDDDGGRWRMLSMPALCTDPARDPLGRAFGDPLPHPLIAEDDTDALLAHWEDKRRSSTPRDWGALYQGDPQPAAGTLLTADELIARRHFAVGGTHPNVVENKLRTAVAVDPSGGGRDTAGIIGGYLSVGMKLYITADRTMRGTADAWARSACELANEIDADVIIFEANYGGDMARSVIRTAWDALMREGVITGFCPNIKAVHGRKSKLLRAEPVAQLWREDHIRTGAYLPDLESEWASWLPGQDSPGRIDASVYLALELLPVPGTSVRVSSPVDMPRIVRR